MMYKYVDTGIYVTEEEAVKAYIGEFKEYGSKFNYKNCKTMDELVEKIRENDDKIADELLTNDDGLFRVVAYTTREATDDECGDDFGEVYIVNDDECGEIKIFSSYDEMKEFYDDGHTIFE